MNVSASTFDRLSKRTGVLRTLWLLITAGVVILLAAATPWRLQMLRADVYGLAGGLAELGISLSFFAAYFVVWELLVAVGSLMVAALIAWKRTDDWFAMLVATSLSLFGLLPPLVEGLVYASGQWTLPIMMMRVLVFGCLMAVLCLFPNGSFAPSWTRWLLLSWLLLSLLSLFFDPQLMVETAVLPNTRTVEDALWPLVGVGWFLLAIAGQIIRYRQHATATEKQQMKWVLLGFSLSVIFTLIVVLLLISFPGLTNTPGNEAGLILVLGGLYLLLGLALPVSFALSILRYRLWDVDILLNRTLVYGGLSLGIAAIYVLLVGGLGSLTAGQSGWIVGAVMATLVVAILIKPLQRQLQLGIDRLVPVSAPALASADAQTAISTADEPLRGLSLLAARLIWLGLLVLALVLWGVGTAGMLQQNLFEAITQGDFPASTALVQVVQNNSLQPGSVVWIVTYGQLAAFLLVGLILFWRKSEDRMGILSSLMLIAIGFGFTANIIFLPFILPGWHIPVTLFQAILFGSILLFLYWFPNGRFYPSWTKLAFTGWLVYSLLWFPFPQLNPHRSSSIWPLAIWMVGVWVGIIAQVWRYQRLSGPAERQQTKWVVAGFVGANFCLFLLILFSLSGAVTAREGPIGVAGSVLVGVLGMGSMLIPVAMAIALFRYRLWDIDLIINRTLVFGGLTLLVLLTYALLVGGLSSLFRAQNSLLISLLATGFIALLFQPVRAWLQRGVNRLMFGERDDPYAVLSRLGRKLQETDLPGQTLPAITATITQTLKLPYAAIELAEGDERQLAAASGEATDRAEEWPLIYQGEIVGWLLAAPRTPSKTFTEKERQLLAAIAAQAGPAAFSERLTSALQKSRERLVLAREEERRRIRRDLHDELGPSLASQTFKLDVALDLLETNPQAAADLLNGIKAQNQYLVSDIRHLVYELRPPALDELGLIGALQAHIGQIETPDFYLTATPDPLPLLPAAVEVAAYRITLEATTNVVRHAQAQRCSIELEAAPTQLTLIITDDGCGLPKRSRQGVGLGSMRERSEELGGKLSLASLASGGTRIMAVLPI